MYSQLIVLEDFSDVELNDYVTPISSLEIPPVLAGSALRVKVCLNRDTWCPGGGLVPHENNSIQSSLIGLPGLIQIYRYMPRFPAPDTKIELDMYTESCQWSLPVAVVVDYECKVDLDLTSLDSKRVSRALTGKLKYSLGAYRGTKKPDEGRLAASRLSKADGRQTAFEEARDMNRDMIKEMEDAVEADRREKAARQSQQSQNTPASGQTI